VDGSTASAGRLANLRGDVGDDLTQGDRCGVIRELVEQFLGGLSELWGGVGVPQLGGSVESCVGLGVGARCRVQPDGSGRCYQVRESGRLVVRGPKYFTCRPA